MLALILLGWRASKLEYFPGWLAYKAVSHQVRFVFKLNYRYEKWKFNHDPANRHWWCAICDKHIARKKRTIDHIIPENICWLLEMPGLIIDPRNFRPAHLKCNSDRGDMTIERLLTEEKLSPKIRDKLFALAKKANMPV